MPLYQLIDSPLFPPPSHAEPDGLLAVGGDLSSERLLLAYSSGIFPWFDDGDPLLWWSPDPRLILDPGELTTSRSLEKLIRQGRFEVTFDRAFRQVITNCAELRKEDGKGTWITGEMIEAYCGLHEAGFAHSVESWHDGQLAGGLYGVCLGRCFFGESMFFTVSNASKVAFVTLVRELERLDFELIDCQMPSGHLKSLGSRGIPRELFLERLILGGVVPSTAPVPGIFPDRVINPAFK